MDGRSLRPLGSLPEMVLDPGPVGINTNLGHFEKALVAPQLDVQGERDRGEGAAALGRGIGNVGTALHELGIKALQAQAITDAANADNEMTTSEGELTAKLAAEPDEKKWQAIAQTHIKATGDKLSKMNISIAARQNVDANFARWQAHRLSGVTVSAAKESINKAVRVGEDMVDLASEKGEIDNAHKGISGLVAGGYWSKEKGELKVLQIAKRQEEKAREALIDASAREALADPDAWLVNNPQPKADVDPGIYLRTRAIAEGASADKFRNSTKAMADTLASAKEPLMPGEVRKMAEGLGMSPSEAEKWQAEAAHRLNTAEMQRRATPEYYLPLFGRLLDEVGKVEKDPNFDKSNPAYRDQLANLRMEITRLPEELRGEVSETLEKKWRQGPPQIDTTVKGYVSQSLTDMFDQGAFGELEKKVMKEKGDPGWYDGTDEMKRVPNIEGRKQAQAARADALISMNQWMKEHPQATREQATAAMYSMSREAVSKVDAKALFKSASEKTTAPAGFDWAGKAAGVASPVGADVLDFVKGFEGYQEKAYGDYKQTSVGYGTRAKHSEEKLTEAEATQRLKEELSGHAVRVDKAAAAVGLKLSAKQRKALISFDFNTGEGDYLIESAKGNMAEIKRRLVLYTKAGGKNSEGLISRRAGEAALLD